MTAELLLQLLISGLGMGFIFALIAIGLALIYGVMGVVNFAHGEFLMISMYASVFAFTLGGLDPVITLPFIAVAMFGFGVAVYYLLMKRVLGGAMHSQIFATFGLMVFLQAAAQFTFGADITTPLITVGLAARYGLAVLPCRYRKSLPPLVQSCAQDAFICWCLEPG
jgi:branched-chain amino acid transport system permease protein